MTGKKDIGDPLDDVVLTGRIGARQQSSSPKAGNSKSQNVQQSSSLECQTSTREAENKQSRSPTVQQSSTLTTQKSKEKRTQQTIYLPNDLAKWLRKQAVEEEREISEIAAEALEMYKRLKG